MKTMPPVKALGEKENASGTETKTRPAGPRSQSYIEVLVDQGRIDVSEVYSDGMADRLAQALERFGLETRKQFASPCG